MIDLISEAHNFQRFCEDRNWQFCFIGGIAVQHWAEPRLTRDVDVSLMTGFGNEAEFITTILNTYQPRIPDAALFAQQHRVLLMRTEFGIDFDVSLAALPFEEEMIKRSILVEFLPDLSLRICCSEDLVVLKCFANRPQDWYDVRSLLVRQGVSNLDWKQIEMDLEPLVSIKGEPQILEQLSNLRKELTD
jgi:hypothetical protein